MAGEQYTLEQAEEDIADIRKEVTYQGIFFETKTLTVDGVLTATGAGSASPSLITTDTWQSLGTLTGATVNVGKYKLLATGFVYVWIDVSFGALTGGSPTTITFSNTLPSGYQPLSTDTDVRAQMSQTNAGGSLSRIFVGKNGGGSAGQVQLNAPGQVLGTYSVSFQYPVTG